MIKRLHIPNLIQQDYPLEEIEEILLEYGESAKDIGRILENARIGTDIKGLTKETIRRG